MWLFDKEQVPHLRTELPGPNARELLDRDTAFVSPSYTRVYPLVVDQGSGAVIRDVDGNLFLDFTAGIAVCTTGHCHPEVVAAIRDQAGKLHPHVGDRLLLRPADRAGRAARGPGAGHVAQEGVLLQQRGGGGRVGPEAGPAPHAIAAGWSPSSGRSTGGPTGPCPCPRRSSPHRRGFSPLVPDIHHVPFPRNWRTFEAGRRRSGCVARDRGGAVPPDGPAGRGGGHLHRAGPGRGRLPRRPAGVPARPARPVRPARHPVRRRRGAERHGPDRQDVRRRARRGRAGHHLPGEGHRERTAARGDHRQGRRHGLAARQPRQHVRRQPGRLPGGPGDHRPARSASTWPTPRPAAGSSATACAT